MKKDILLIAGGLAALSVTLIALPSPSAAVQEQGNPDTAVLQKKLKNLEKLRDLEKLQRVQVDPGEVLESIGPAVEQYEDAMQVVKELPGELEQIAVFDGEEGPSWLGVETQEVTSETAKELKLPAERGVVIGSVTPDSPAAKAGLKEKDVITEVNGQRVEGAAQFRRMVHEIPAGRTAQLTVWRDGRAQTGKRRIVLAGDLPSSFAPPSGCLFRTRCPKATALCAETAPAQERVSEGHRVLCHYWRE